MEAGFEYANADTRTFITKWNEATKEIVSLREKFNNVIEASDFFFAYCEKKGLQIKDKTIKARVFAAIDAKKDSFADACRKSSKAITSLERSMQQGQDIISALEIAGALRGIQGKIRELDVLHDQATSKLPAIDQLVDEGLNILNAEFESL
jgi:hypothetical protein